MSKTIKPDSYFIHQVDRWPDSGMYGDGYCIYVEGVHYVILDYDKEKKSFSTKSGHVIEVGNNEPDHDLFLGIIGNSWDRVYRARWKDIDDENYTDYVPMFYRTIQNFLDKKGEFYNK